MLPGATVYLKVWQIRGHTSKMLHSHGTSRSNYTAFWQKAPVSHHVDLSMGLLPSPQSMASDFPQSEWSDSERHLSWPSLDKHTLPSAILFIRREALSQSVFLSFIFFFFAWLLWLGLPLLCWIRVARVGTLVLFLNSALCDIKALFLQIMLVGSYPGLG